MRTQELVFDSRLDKRWQGNGESVEELLSGMVKDIVSNSYSWMDDEADFHPPFANNEKCIHSLIMPGIAKRTDRFMMEWETFRQTKSDGSSPSGREETRGFIDYFIRLNSKRHVLLELKHGWITGRKTTNPEKSTFDKWTEALDQLQRITSEELTRFEGGYKIAFMPVTVWIGGNTPDSDNSMREIEANCALLCNDYPYYRNALSEVMTNGTFYGREFSDRPNWGSLWFLKEGYRAKRYYGNKEDKYYRFFPACFFFAHVSRIIC